MARVDMRKLAVVFKREYLERIRSKWFLIGTLLGPVFFGAITSVSTGCTTPANNGSFFEVDRFTVVFGALGALTIEAANQSSTCTYAGTAFYSTNGGDIIVPSGTFSCSNGLQGTWASDRIQFDPIGLLANITTKYTASESCATVGHIGAAR